MRFRKRAVCHKAFRGTDRAATWRRMRVTDRAAGKRRAQTAYTLHHRAARLAPKFHPRFSQRGYENAREMQRASADFKLNFCMQKYQFIPANSTSHQIFVWLTLDRENISF